MGLSVNSLCQVSMFTKVLSASIASFAKVFTNNVIELNQNVSIYPNPANDKIFIEGKFSSQSIEIIDMNGKLVISRTADSNITEIDITNLTQGVYLVRVSNIAVGKFVKK